MTADKKAKTLAPFILNKLSSILDVRKQTQKGIVNRIKTHINLKEYSKSSGKNYCAFLKHKYKLQ